jgi:hypothetical protein
LAEGPCEPVRGEWIAVQTGEHVPAVPIGLANVQALTLLALPVPRQRGDGRAVQRDRPYAAGGLRWTNDHVTVVLLQLLVDGCDAAVQVEIAPPQAARLAAP